MKIKQHAAFQGADVSALFSKYRVLIVLSTGVCLALSVFAASVLPKKYKAQFVLTVDSRYFQSPLIREFVPELNQRSDVKAEVASMARQTLTPDFLDRVGETYGIYHPQIPSEAANPLSAAWRQFKAWAQPYGLFQSGPEREFDVSVARKALRDRIGILDLNDTTFQMSFVDTDPTRTFQVTQAINEHVTQTLGDQRSNNLSSVRDAIRKRLNYLAANVTVSTEPAKSARSDLAREELSSVRDQIRTMSRQYTNEHPVMQELKSREQSLSRMLTAAGNVRSSRSGGSQGPILGGESNMDVREMYTDLLRKMNYLNIALESDQGRSSNYVSVLESPIYPMEPVGPKKVLFAAGGCALGLFLALFIAAIREYFHRSTLRPDTLADQLGIPLLGKLPIVSWNESSPVHRG